MFLLCAVGIVWYWFAPSHTDVGYQPIQPINYSHKLHAGQMGMDCRYCHHGVEKGPHANVPPTETCMNCHAKVRTDSPEIQKLAALHEKGESPDWIKVHMLPDYAYFNHAAHLNAGVGCYSCHGAIDKQEIVRQSEPLSMGWCLRCHRDPSAHLRPADELTLMQPANAERAAQLWEQRKDQLNPPQHCSGCHR